MTLSQFRFVRSCQHIPSNGRKMFSIWSASLQLKGKLGTKKKENKLQRFGREKHCKIQQLLWFVEDMVSIIHWIEQFSIFLFFFSSFYLFKLDSFSLLKHHNASKTSVSWGRPLKCDFHFFFLHSSSFSLFKCYTLKHNHLNRKRLLHQTNLDSDILLLATAVTKSNRIKSERE